MLKIKMDCSTLYGASISGGNDAMSGQTQLMFPSLFRALPDIKSDKLNGLAIEGHGAEVESSTPEQLGALIKNYLVKLQAD